MKNMLVKLLVAITIGKLLIERPIAEMPNKIEYAEVADGRSFYEVDQMVERISAP